MRIVRPHQDRVGGTQILDDLFDVIFGVSHGKAVTIPDGARALLHLAVRPVARSGHTAHLVHLVYEARNPFGAVLDTDHAKFWKALEEVGVDERAHGHHDRDLTEGEHPLPRALALTPVEQRLLAPLPDQVMQEA